MKKDTLIKIFSACAGITHDGQLTVKNNNVSFSHSDTSGVSMGCIEFGLNAPDGVYGIDFNKVNGFLGAVKEKEGDITVEKSRLVLKFGAKRVIPHLVVSTLKPIRPRISEKMTFTCKVEVDKNEFIDIINIIDKSLASEQNSVPKIEIGYNGKNVYVKTVDDPVDYTEKPFEIISIEEGRGDTFTSFYPFDYLREFASVFKKVNSDSLQMWFGDDSPIVFRIKDDDISIEYLLAQMVDRS